MNYISLSFITFVLITLITYYVAPKSKRWYVLLVASLVFYLMTSVKYSIYIFVSVIISYFAALCITKKTRNSKKVLIISVISIVSILGLLKFFGWGTGLLNLVLGWFGIKYALPVYSFVLPLGISFYTLQCISYLVDTYKENIQPESNILKFTLYICYFPTIVQGPIHRFSQISKQLYYGHKFDYDRILHNLQLVGWGLIKKMVIADSLMLYVSKVFEKPAEYSGIVLYVGMIYYTVQLYMDFSGCVDICRGVSGMFGIELTENFLQPYYSRSIKEFWSRWHISLSTWLKDYIYIPLGGNKKGKSRKYINLLIVFFISGLWHGYGFTFIIWGVLHAIYQVVGELTKKYRDKIKKFLFITKGSLSEKIYQIFITFHLVGFAWVFFNAGRMSIAIQYIKNMFSDINFGVLFDKTIYEIGMSEGRSRFIIIITVFVFLIEILEIKGYRVREKVKQLHLPLRWLLYIGMILVIIIYGVYGVGYNPSDFIYGGF